MKFQATPDAELTEAAFAKLLFSTSKASPGLAHIYGWRLVYHTFRSQHSPSGFPDYVLVRERVVFAELKTEKGKPTPFQTEWLDGLRSAGAEVYLWRPSDLTSGEIGRVLSRRTRS